MYNLGEDITQCININRSMSIAYDYTTALMASQHILVPHPLLEHNSNQTVQSSTSWQHMLVPTIVINWYRTNNSSLCVNYTNFSIEIKPKQIIVPKLVRQLK